MGTTNDNRSSLIPQGTLSEKLAGKKRGRFFVSISVIVAIHCAVVAAMLIQGCSKTTDNTVQTNTESLAVTENDASTTSEFYSEFPDKSVTTSTEVAPSATSTEIPAAQTNAVNPLPSTLLPIAPVSTNEPPPIGTQTLSVTSNVVAPVPIPAATSSTGEMRIHTVVSGDSFYKIAKTYGVTVKAIADANPDTSSNKLKIGQKISVPAAGVATGTQATTKAEEPKHANGSSYADPTTGVTYYWVKGGDNLGKIAKKFGVSAKEIQTLNRLSSPNVIRVGQKLQIPEKKAVVSTSAATATTSVAVNPVVPATPSLATVSTTNDLIKTQY